jgi:hypothetical protein
MHRSTSLLSPVLLLVAALALSACSDDGVQPDAGPTEGGTPDGGFPNKPGGNPLVPEMAAFPFPSDFYLVEDKTTATGYRVNIPQEALNKRIPAKLFNTYDGWPRIPSILARLPGGIDPKTLPDPTDPSITVSDSSPAFLVQVGTWKRVPILVEVDMMALTEKVRSLIIRPLRLLEEKSQYVVILRDKLHDTSGQPHKANAAFRALRDGVKTNIPEIEKQREDFKQATAAIKNLKLKPEEVVLAWTFRTRSEVRITETLLAVQEAMNNFTPTSYTITKDKDETSGTKTNRQIVATFKVPDFVDKDGKITLDKDGKPVKQGERDVEFGLTIPSTVDGPRPMILYGHGFFGSWIQGTRGSWNEIATTYKFNTAATKMGFHEDLMPKVLLALTSDLTKMDDVVAEVTQSLAHVTALGRLVEEKLATDIRGKDSSGGTLTLIDDKKIHYHGISNGGTFGYVVAATSPLLSRASIIVGGGGLIHFLQRAVQWNQYAVMLNLLYPNSMDQQLLMSMVQLVLDPVDSMNYSEHLVTKRYAGYKPLKLAVHMAVNDSQVRNLVTEWVVRSAEVPMITPSSKQVYGLKTIAAPSPGGAPAGTQAAFFVYDEKVSPSPVTNVPPKTDNDTHGTVRKLSVYKQHVSTFLEEGKFIQVCSGACDPE